MPDASIQHSPQGHTQEQAQRRVSVNPTGALFSTPGAADTSATAYVRTPVTFGTLGPEAGQVSAANTTSAPSSIRVFLLLENRLLRESLARHFRNRPDLLVVGQSGHAEATPRRVLDSRCDVLVIDSLQTAWLPVNITLESADDVRFRTVVIAMDSNEEQFLAAVRSGVTGYLLQDASAADVVAAVRAVFRGEAVCPPQLCSTLFGFVAQTAREMPLQNLASRPDLTLRQQQLVSLVAKGLTNKEIASQLNLSEFTVRNHIHRILKLVDAGSRSEAVETIRAYGYPIGQDNSLAYSQRNEVIPKSTSS
jgi:two-component system, NarL family, nitrate/nitrite response regulator NarL